MKYEDWEEKSLDELGFVGRGKSRFRPRNAPHLYGGKYPFIQTADVKKANLYLSDYSQTYSDAGLAQSKLWNEGTLCITISANIAEVSILKIKACFPDSIIGFIPDKSICDVRYIKYYFDIFQKTFQQISQGSTQDNLSASKLLSLKIPIPPLKTQKKIAKILSNYDDLIENNLKQIKLLEEKARLTYEEWFLRFRVDGVELEIDSDSGLPFGWERVPLSKIGEFLNGYAFKPKDLLREGFPIVKIKEMKAGIVEDTPRNHAKGIDEKYFVKRGDILFSWSATLEVIQWRYEKSLLNQHLFKVTPKENFSKSLVYLILKDSLKIFDNLTTGATMKHIRRSELDFVKVIVPNNIYMKKFDISVKPILKQIINLSQQNQNLKEARDILLPRLMTGVIEP